MRGVETWVQTIVRELKVGTEVLEGIPNGAVPITLPEVANPSVIGYNSVVWIARITEAPLEWERVPVKLGPQNQGTDAASQHHGVPHSDK